MFLTDNSVGSHENIHSDTGIFKFASGRRSNVIPSPQLSDDPEHPLNVSCPSNL